MFFIVQYQYSIVHYFAVQYIVVKYSPLQYSVYQHNSTVQYSVSICSTVQQSNEQSSLVQYNVESCSLLYYFELQGIRVQCFVKLYTTIYNKKRYVFHIFPILLPPTMLCLCWGRDRLPNDDRKWEFVNSKSNIGGNNILPASGGCPNICFSVGNLSLKVKNISKFLFYIITKVCELI